ncbi:SDR family oxidoreductase [Streptomyces werraensis]|uniref:SDR family oxidoreductase n=1 Tax=Streptomyces werraensis TaxID=68284 RepID=UPI0036C73630
MKDGHTPVDAIPLGQSRTPVTAGITFDTRGVPLRRAGDPEDIAPAVLCWASDESGFVTGTELAIDGCKDAGPSGSPPEGHSCGCGEQDGPSYNASLAAGTFLYPQDGPHPAPASCGTPLAHQAVVSTGSAGMRKAVSVQHPSAKGTSLRSLSSRWSVCARTGLSRADARRGDVSTRAGGSGLVRGF